MSLKDYRLLSQLGAGPDGIAFRALAGDGARAVKVFDLSRARSSTGRWEQLAPRLRLAFQFEHPCAIRVLELGMALDPPYAVLEWVDAQTIAEAASAGGSRSRAEVIELVRALAGVLSAAHRMGLPHGRIGPSQVLLVEGNQPKLDFTSARVGVPAEPEMTRTSAAPGHEAEPGLRLAAARAADIQSLGRLLAWLLTGQTDRQQCEPRVSELNAGAPLAELVRTLLADDPSERPTAHEVEEQLGGLLAPMDFTGEWSKPAERVAPSNSIMRSGARELKAAGSEYGTLEFDSGSPRLGRYRLLEKLGEGGQGIVHRALDPSDGSIVAIKILRTDRVEQPAVLRRFRKEARLMAEANNPYVVNLLEFNEDDGIPYMVLEFVAGESLGELLAERTRLDEKEALSIMAAVARGLMQAHERGIVHRDIKPSNILLLDPSQTDSGPLAEQDGFALSGGHDAQPQFRADPRAVTVSSTLDGAALPQTARPQIKISDFGLARHIVDTESLALTAAGSLLGTPHYMAPEQWTGRAVDPRTDVYAMGATLFHLLAGRPPFAALTRDDLCAQHCNAPPPRLATFNPGASDGVARVIERALCKQPEDRYVDAGAMLRDIEALLHGKLTDVAIHPRLPECDPHRVVRFEFRWELESSPRQLWPLVTNTDRLDRAIGFAPLVHKTRYEPGRGVRTFTEGRKAGMVEVGEEHPYEWIEPRRMGVLREYSQGPFRWLVSVVELLPRPGGGTTLIHHLRLEPSSWTIRVGSRWGVGVGLRKSLARVYQRIDATVKSQRQHRFSPGVDPFEEPARMPALRRQRLERLLDRLAAHGIDPAAVERLGEHMARGSAQEVARIRPLALAERFRLDPEQVIAACLHGASEGLLEMHWDLLCPVCRISCQVTDTLRAIAEHAHCEACHLDFQLDFANSIELFFRVHPEIREADLGTYCVGGPAHAPHALAQMRIAPDERIELELELPTGSYRLRGPQLPWSVDFQVQSSATFRRWDIDLGSARAPGCPPVLRSGGQILILNNPHPRELVVRVERTAPRSDALTAARVASLALFRELFPRELLAPGQLATVSTVTFLVTALDPAQADFLYEDLGDGPAFSVIHKHFQCLADAIRQEGGAVIKSMGEGVLASFGEVTAAVRAALELPHYLDRSEATPPLGLRVGIHRGTTLAATINDHLDYFGTTARQAAGILRHARDRELVLTQTVAADPEVAALLHERRIETEVVPTDLSGHPHVIRLRLYGHSALERGPASPQGRTSAAAARPSSP
jgi:serine/threonine protein kinase/class 3 adenylate cyclase